MALTPLRYSRRRDPPSLRSPAHRTQSGDTWRGPAKNMQKCSYVKGVALPEPLYWHWHSTGTSTCIIDMASIHSNQTWTVASLPTKRTAFRIFLQQNNNFAVYQNDPPYKQEWLCTGMYVLVPCNWNTDCTSSFPNSSNCPRKQSLRLDKPTWCRGSPSLRNPAEKLLLTSTTAHDASWLQNAI